MPRNRTINDDLRVEVVKTATDEMRRVGPDRFRVANVAARFADRGVHAATIYRWVGAAVKSGMLSQAVVHDVKKFAKRKARKSADPAAAAKTMLVPRLPAVATLDDIAGTGPIRVIDYLGQCIKTARLVMQHATGEDGKPKLTKTLLAASEHLRRCLETAHRIAEQINELDRVEEFHRSIIEEVQKESPDCAHRILVRLDQFTTGSML